MGLRRVGTGIFTWDYEGSGRVCLHETTKGRDFCFLFFCFCFLHGTTKGRDWLVYIGLPRVGMGVFTWDYEGSGRVGLHGSTKGQNGVLYIGLRRVGTGFRKRSP